LASKIKTGLKEQNYVGFFDDERLIAKLQELDLPYLSVANNYYLYIIPDRVRSESSAAKYLHQLLLEHGHVYDVDYLRSLMQPQEVRYIRLLTNMNAKIAKMIKDAKNYYYTELAAGVPLLHGIGLEEYQRRYYPFGDFMANVI
jgi:cell division protein FtsI/penicillin-binding protein 2